MIGTNTNTNTNTYYILKGLDRKTQENYWVPPFINSESNNSFQYLGYIIRSNDYSSYYNPTEQLEFELYYFKSNLTQLQINKYDVFNNKYKLTFINKFVGTLDDELSLRFELDSNYYKLRFNLKEEPGTLKKLIMHPELTIKYNI
jgi:hypothetical protein